MSIPKDSKKRFKKYLKKPRKRRSIDEDEWQLIQQKRKNEVE